MSDLVVAFNELKSFVKEQSYQSAEHLKKFDEHMEHDAKFQATVGGDISAIKTNIDWLKWGVVTIIGSIVTGFIGMTFFVIQFLIKK